MKISTLAKLSSVGLIFIYSSKLVDTLNHGIFRPKAFAVAIVGINILSGLAPLLFFIALYRRYSTLVENKMMKTINLAIIGSAIALLPKLLAMARLYQNQSLFFFLRHGNHIGAFCPWLSALLLFSFCFIALFESDIRQNIGLKKAFTAGFVGWLIMCIAHTLVLLNFLHSGQLTWLADLSKTGPAIFVISSTVSFICLLIFYGTFIKIDNFYQQKVT